MGFHRTGSPASETDCKLHLLYRATRARHRSLCFVEVSQGNGERTVAVLRFVCR